MKSIEITIDGDGNVEVEALGFKGKGCTEAVDVFSKALGKVVETKKTGDYYAKEAEAVKVGWKK